MTHRHVAYQRPRGGSKKFVQQGRSHFCAQSVLPVREHRKMARTPLAVFFNSPFVGLFSLCDGPTNKRTRSRGWCGDEGHAGLCKSHYRKRSQSFVLNSFPEGARMPLGTLGLLWTNHLFRTNQGVEFFFSHKSAGESFFSQGASIF